MLLRHVNNRLAQVHGHSCLDYWQAAVVADRSFRVTCEYDVTGYLDRRLSPLLHSSLGSVHLR